jgi:elongation factor Tu
MRAPGECTEDERKIGRGSISELIKVLDDHQMPPRPLQLPLMMPVENVYNITGRGVVVTGKIEQGTVKIGDNVEVVGINPTPVAGQCTGVEMFRKILDVGEAGENVGICLKGPKKEECYRGQVLAKPGTIKTFKKFKADIFLLDKKEGGRQKPVGNNYKPQFFFRTADITGSVTLAKPDAMIMPGDHTNITVDLIYTMPIEKGLRFTIREGGKTIGAGIIIETIEEKDDKKTAKGAAAAAKPGAKPAAAAGAKPAAAAKPAGAAKPAPKK